MSEVRVQKAKDGRLRDDGRGKKEVGRWMKRRQISSVVLHLSKAVFLLLSVSVKPKKGSMYIS